MSAKIRFILLTALLLLLVGCGRGFGDVSTAPVDDSTVTTTLSYLDGIESGPEYTVTMNVPDAWVGNFEVENRGNVAYFYYIGENAPGRVFSVEALSPAQYWEMSGGYPNSHTNIVNKGDTYFVYYLPIDAYYSGLGDELFTMLAADVPAVIASFEAAAN